MWSFFLQTLRKDDKRLRDKNVAILNVQFDVLSRSDEICCYELPRFIHFVIIAVSGPAFSVLVSRYIRRLRCVSRVSIITSTDGDSIDRQQVNSCQIGLSAKSFTAS